MLMFAQLPLTGILTLTSPRAMSTSQLLMPLEIARVNIRYDNPEDGKNQWKFRKETLMDYFLQNTPDVVGMQEVLHNQLNDLTSTLEDYAYVGV